MVVSPFDGAHCDRSGYACQLSVAVVVTYFLSKEKPRRSGAIGSEVALFTDYATNASNGRLLHHIRLVLYQLIEANTLWLACWGRGEAHLA